MIDFGDVERHPKEEQTDMTIFGNFRVQVRHVHKRPKEK